jgi:hypothetical protein
MTTSVPVTSVSGGTGYFVTATDYLVLCDATGTGNAGKPISLPAAAGNTGRMYVIKQVNAQSAGSSDQCKVSPVAVNPTTPNGFVALRAPDASSTNSISTVTLVSDGTRWWVLNTGP